MSMYVPVQPPFAAATTGRATDSELALIVAGVALLVGLGFGLRALIKRRRRATTSPTAASDQPTASPATPFEQRSRRPTSGVALTAGAAALALLVGAVAVIAIVSGRSSSTRSELASNPYLDPGTALSRSAPNFTLTDQFGKLVALSAFRGKVVILAFNDSECTTICPLTTTAMVDAKAMLGAAGSQVQLLGIDANPNATAIHDVLSYSELHGMLREWHFMTGSLAHLKHVWKQYGIEVAIERGQVDHTPALFVIDPRGRLRRLYLTQQSYGAVGQLGQLLAQEASTLLPGHPRVESHLSYAPESQIRPAESVSLPRAGGGTIRLGAGRPRMSLFFATWDREVTDLGKQLAALNAYAASATPAPLTAVDESSVEPSPSALPAFLRGLPRGLSYPVAIDRSGRVADGYEVQGEPWLVLTSAAGRIIWYRDVSTSGWLSAEQLAAQVRAALARAPQTASGEAAIERELTHSPKPLAALHTQAGRLLGSEPALAARLRALRGYPVVVNAWASWCTPCRAEFSLFANASAQFGRRVAFLGADTSDSAGDARSFLATHPVNYPSYQVSTTQLQSILPGGLQGLPTTIYISPAGKVLFVHTGQYQAQGSLDADVHNYALGR
jgi:cytochrome oxidase Cu insertion factor (SCO1/SenC/PrrC family)/thiol-disulfide isomerase/thioredoxin